MEVLLILATVFSGLVLTGLIVLMAMAIWFIRQVRVLGAVRLLVSKQKQP